MQISHIFNVKWELVHYMKHNEKRKHITVLTQPFQTNLYSPRTVTGRKEADRNLSSPESDTLVPGSQEHFSDISRAPCTKIYIP